MRYLERILIVMSLVVLLAFAGGLAQAQGPTAHVTLEVEGMVCPLCQATVERTLAGVPGVIEAKASFVTGKADIDYDPNRVSPSQLVETINTKTFYRARLALGDSAGITAATPRILPVAGLVGVIALGSMAVLAMGGFLWYVARKPMRPSGALPGQPEADESMS